MSAPSFIILFCNQSQQGPGKLHHAFLEERAARQRVADDIARGIYDRQATYENLMAEEHIVHFPVLASVLRRLAKSGVVFVAFHSDLRNRHEAQPFAVAASRTGLVNEVRKTAPTATAFTLFEDSHEANAFLIEGFALPAGASLWSSFTGPLLNVRG